jgi:hypothetical protein
MSISHIYTNFAPSWFTHWANKKRYKLFRIVRPNRKGNETGPTTTLTPKNQMRQQWSEKTKHEKFVLTYTHDIAANGNFPDEHGNATQPVTIKDYNSYTANSLK